MGKQPSEFEQVYEQYQPLIFGSLKQLSIYGNREDALQEARLALWEAYTRFEDGQGSFAAFAARYVKGRLKRYLTNENRHKPTVMWSQLQVGEEEKEIDIPDAHAQQSFLECEWREGMEQVWSLLSARERLLIKEHVLQGHRLTVIAETQGVSPETVKTWKKRALKKLRAHLSPDLLRS